jgi:hypothetical protein
MTYSMCEQFLTRDATGVGVDTFLHLQNGDALGALVFGLWSLVFGIAGLSILCGDATGPFRLYGGLLFSWEK